MQSANRDIQTIMLATGKSHSSVKDVGPNTLAKCLSMNMVQCALGISPDLLTKCVTDPLYYFSDRSLRDRSLIMAWGGSAN